MEFAVLYGQIPVLCVIRWTASALMRISRLFVVPVLSGTYSGIA